MDYQLNFVELYYKIKGGCWGVLYAENWSCAKACSQWIILIEELDIFLDRYNNLSCITLGKGMT